MGEVDFHSRELCPVGGGTVNCLIAHKNKLETWELQAGDKIYICLLKDSFLLMWRYSQIGRFHNLPKKKLCVAQIAVESPR